ncbi:MAG: transposase [Candidatus Magnetobacterium sp. LHC-1]
MRYKPPKITSSNEMAYIYVCRLTEDKARVIRESIRWPDGIKCPHCTEDAVKGVFGKRLSYKELVSNHVLL